MSPEKGLRYFGVCNGVPVCWEATVLQASNRGVGVWEHSEKIVFSNFLSSSLLPSSCAGYQQACGGKPVILLAKFRVFGVRVLVFFW